MSDLIDLSKYKYIFMAQIDCHGDKEKMHNAGIVKINKEDISIAYVGISHAQKKDEDGYWKTTTHCFDICFKMKCGVDISIPREDMEVKDPNYAEKSNLLKIQLKQELDELLGVSDAG